MQLKPSFSWEDCRMIDTQSASSPGSSSWPSSLGMGMAALFVAGKGTVIFG